MYSLHDAVPFSARISEPRILGSWTTRTTNGVEYATVSELDAGLYQVVYIKEDRDTSVLYGMLSPFNDRLLLDLEPDQAARNTIERYGGIMVHGQVLLSFAGDSLLVTFFDPDTLKALLERGDVRMGHAVLPHGDLLLTDLTERLATGLAAASRRQGVVTPAVVYNRLRSDSTRP